MDHELLLERLFETLINGDRPGSRALVQEAAEAGMSAPELVSDVFWPTYERVEKLHRSDQLTRLAHRMATKLLRTLVDQNASRLPLARPSGESILAFCGPNDADELGAQMAVDLIEANGFNVRFAGGGIPGDEIMAQVHETRPNVLLMFASAPGDLPEIRRMIDQMREIGAVPNLRIVVGGGVFNRAEGLAEEIGAHASATSPLDLVDLLSKPIALPGKSVRKTRAAA